MRPGRTPPGGPNGCCAGTPGSGGTGTARSSPNCWCPRSRSARASAGRTLDVVRGGIVARLSAGLRGVPLRDSAAAATGMRPDAGVGRHVTASLVALGCCLAVVLGFGAAMWSQLTIGWQWSAPGRVGSAAAFATVTTSIAMPVLLAIAAAGRAAGAVRRRPPVRRRPGGRPAPRRRRPWSRPARSWSPGAGISRTAGPAPAATAASSPAGWPRSSGRRRCRSPRTGRTRAAWPASPPPRSPGWRSARWPRRSRSPAPPSSSGGSPSRLGCWRSRPVSPLPPARS